MKIFNYIVSAAFCTLTMASCTDLSETLYDQVASGNYYNTKNDVVRATFRPLNMLIGALRAVMYSTNLLPTN